MMSAKAKITGLLAAATLAGCTTMPETNSALEEVQADYERLASQPYAQKYAPQKLNRAEQAVNKAEQVWESDKDADLVHHAIYLAERRVAIAEEAAELGRAQQFIQSAQVERQQVLLSIRRAEARQAQAQATQAEKRAQQLEQALAEMEGEMENLKAETTSEGIVLTLDDILFDLNQASLRPGAERTLDRVAEFLKKYESRQLEIKGYTDSTGSTAYNQALSERRAQSVEEALARRGVNPDRIITEGYGEKYPVATNDTRLGRQQNRRVEIVIQNPVVESLSGL